MNSLLFIVAQATEGGSSIMGVLPLLLMFVVLYFFMIRPQMKKQKQMTKFREALKEGDKVVTTGGIYGKIVNIKETHIILQVDTNTRLKVDKSTLLSDMSDNLPKK